MLGGDFGGGTVFQLSPTANGWVHTVLYSFTGGADGGEPYKGVTIDSEGNLYGTAVTGGSGSCEGGCGVAYKLTNSGGTWTQTVIHAFTGGDDGSGPGARVTVDRSGNVYGMAPTGGAYGSGTIYKIRQVHNGAWNLKVIHAFTGGADGGTGSAGRMILRNGHLYGAATTGGTYEAELFSSSRRGELESGISGRFIPSGANRTEPCWRAVARCLQYHGTTYYGGANGIGAVYKLSRRPIGEWNENVLYSFQDGADGNSPISNLVFGGGSLYGTTSEGGLGSGTIFKLSSVGGGQWIETIVHSFQGPPDGAFSYNGMVVDRFETFTARPFMGAMTTMDPSAKFYALSGVGARSSGGQSSNPDSRGEGIGTF